MGRRTTRTLCVILVCLIVAPGCGQVDTSADANREAESSEPVPRPSPQQGKDAGEALVGTVGDDEIRGGEGSDRLYGGPGNDVLDAQDLGSVGKAGRDEISCGPGRDEVLMDVNDGEKPQGCEMFGVGSS